MGTGVVTEGVADSIALPVEILYKNIFFSLCGIAIRSDFGYILIGWIEVCLNF